jgi:integrase
MNDTVVVTTWPPLLDFFRTRYCPDHASDLQSAESIADYEIQLKHFSTWWQESHQQPPTVEALTRESIASAMAWLAAQGRAAATVNKLRRVLRAIAGHAAEVLDLPMPKKIKPYKQPKRKPSAWSEAQMGEILWVAEQLQGSLAHVTLGQFFTALIRTQYNTGSRITALMRVRWEAIDLQTGILTLKASDTKDNEEQHLTLQPETVQALAALRVGNLGGPFDHWPYDRGPAGCRRRPWKALTGQLKKVFYVALIDSDADVNAVTLDQVREVIGRRDCTHKIRRTFATEIASRNGIEVAQELLGHADRATTLGYVDQSRMPKTSARDILPRLTPRPPKWKLFAG